MRLFNRRNAASDDAGGVIGPDAEELARLQGTGVTDDEEEGTDGPWDIAAAPDLDGRIDLGAVKIPKRDGLQVRMELDKKTRRVVAVNLALDGSSLQVQAFAAPRSEGLWDELREEIAGSIRSQGGTVEERDGVFGAELLARLPVRMPDGRSGTRPARFIGVDGPRWFLRGVVTGKGTVETDAAEVMEQIFASIVVDRGSEPRPPRELLTLHLPGQAPVAPAAEQGRPALRLPKRGPEITEVR